MHAELTPSGELFVDETQSEMLMHDCEVLAKSCFYGSMHGFQVSHGNVIAVCRSVALVGSSQQSPAISAMNRVRFKCWVRAG